MKLFASGDHGNVREPQPVITPGNGTDTEPGPPSGDVVGGRRYSRAEAMRLIGASLAGTTLLTTGLTRAARAATSPSYPGSLYVLN
jgi:hypothetical protein